MVAFSYWCKYLIAFPCYNYELFQNLFPGIFDSLISSLSFDVIEDLVVCTILVNSNIAEVSSKFLKGLRNTF